ncbi:hypothetical protein PENSPDRAFT_672483, partial [Peniophora sp. CONT]
GLLAKGLLRLRPGDAVFARPFNGKEDGTEDVLQVLVLGDGQVLSKHITDLREARDDILGPRDERGPNVPRQGSGGTAFERSGYADPVEDGARAYSILTSEQKVRGRTVGPGVSCKVRPQDRQAAGPTMRLKALKAAVNAGVAAAKYLPVRYQEALKTQAELVNAPRFGSDDNYLFSSVQVNIARPVPFKAAGQTLKDLGSFGKPHVDRGDMPEGFTSVQACSDLPPEIDAGQFVIIEIGVFIDLEGTVFALFRGVQYHTGCAPRPKRADYRIPDWAYRILFVTYPKAAVYLGLGRYILGSLRTVKQIGGSSTKPVTQAKAATPYDADDESDGEGAASSSSSDDDSAAFDHDVSRRYLAIGPDILNNPESKSQETWITHPNFARDALGIMSPGSLMQFYAQSLYLLDVFAVRQIPESLGVQIDADKFLSAFSYLDDSGDRKSLNSWQYAPRVNDPEGNEARRSAASAWRDFSAHVTQAIPFSLAKQKTRASNLRKGKPVPREFDVHGVGHESETDGAERPRDKFFKPVRSFKTPVEKDHLCEYVPCFMSPQTHMSSPSAGPAGSAGKRKRKDAGSKGATPDARQDLDSVGSDADVDDQSSTPDFIPRRSQRNLRRALAQDQDHQSSTGVEDSPPPRKKSRLDGKDRSSEVQPASLIPPCPKPEDNVAYQEWLRKLLGSTPMHQHAHSDLRRQFTRAHAPPVSALAFDVADGALIQPWSNPLNGPLREWQPETSPCLGIDDLPIHGQNMFTFDALDKDFYATFQQSRTVLSDSLVALGALPDTLTRAVACSVSLQVQASLDAASYAYTGLQHLRARLTSNSIFSRVEAVTLMAHEAVLCTCLESLASHHSQRHVKGDSYLNALNIALWKAIDERADIRDFTFTYKNAASSLQLSASPRSLRNDFDRQRLVYTACLDVLCTQVGVDDSRVFRIRAWLVWCVVLTLGFDALYHGDVWLGWQFPQTRCTDMRLRKEPSLDLLLPFLGHVSTRADNSDRPFSALASVALAVCTSDERVRCIGVAQWFTTSLAQPAKYRPLSSSTVPAQASSVYRSLAVLARLIGLPHNQQHLRGAVDVKAISTFMLHGVESPLSPADRNLLTKAAGNPDLYMPYRVHAPSAQCLRRLFAHQDANVLLTDLGFRNLVATRYITYNSKFLLSGEQTFVADVHGLLSAFKIDSNRKKDYYISQRIYGTNRSRYIERLSTVWDHSVWPQELGRNFMAVWRALSVGVDKDAPRYKIPNVGPLLSLQICGNVISSSCCSNSHRSTGDYYVAGHLDAPTVLQMGQIIHSINSGGVKGLELMGFLKKRTSGTHDLGAVQVAFGRYFDWITSITSEEERAQWSWSVVTAENHLCKHSRLHDLISKLE